MALVNRDKDPSEQKDVLNWASRGAVATGVTLYLGVVPAAESLQSVSVAAHGVSNAMQVTFNIERFVVGAGITVIPIGISNLVLVNMSTSGILGFSGLVAQGSTLLSLQYGDVLSATTSGTNGNALDITMELVLKKVQDIVSYNGVAS